MQQDRSSIIVVGAGPTGLTAALELARFGVAVRLIEKSARPATTSRAIGIQARTLELMEQRGLVDEMLALGNKGVAGSIWGGGRRVFRLEYSHIDSRYGFNLFLSQAETERIFRDALDRAGVAIEWGLELVAFEQGEHPPHVSATLRHADGRLETATASYLIGAEGAHSRVRETLGIPFEGASLPEQYALGDLYFEGELAQSDFHIFSSEHGFMGMVPMGNDRFRIIASNPPGDVAAANEPSLGELQSIYDQRSPVPGRFRDMSWGSWFRINSRMTNRLRVGRVFLGGDAAHIHSPAGAQGMNTGIQDMIDLGWKLAAVANGEADSKLLDTYAADRLPVIRDVLFKTEKLTAAIGSQDPLFRGVFDLLAPWIVGTDFVQTNSATRLSQIGLNYRSSPLSVTHRHAGSLRAGDRVPDMQVVVRDAADSAARRPRSAPLISILDPSAFTLLFCTIDDSDAVHGEASNTLAAWHSLLRAHHISADPNSPSSYHERFGEGPTVVLVRPDGYIGFIGSDRSIPELVTYLNDWYGPGARSQSGEMSRTRGAAHA